MSLEQRKLTLARVIVPLGFIAVLGFSFEEKGICFRKYNAEKNACKGKTLQEFTDTESNACCRKHGQGYSLELKRHGTNKKWFECVPCSKYSDEFGISQTASLEPQVDDPTPDKEKIQTVEKVRSQSKKIKGGLMKENKITLDKEKNSPNEENSFKSQNELNEKLNKRKEEEEDEWSPWSDWGPCSKSCGDGLHQRTRFCLQVNCKDEDYQERPCADLKPCLVDGDWSDWSDWSVCNVTCGEGYEERRRTCTNPAPTNGGKDCEGPRTESRKCKEELPCPVDGGWSVWSDWTICSATCGEGFQTRSRQCNNPLPQRGGKPCEGIELESMPCVARTNCAVDGNWTEWSKMDICSARPCSGEPGYRTRFRSCTNPRPMFGGKSCKGRSWMREVCYNNDFCTEKVDGGWCKWSDWSSCKNGITKRSRTCSCPPSANDGKHCKGDEMEEKTCVIVIQDQEEEIAATMKTSTAITKRGGCYDNEGSGDGSDVNCDQEPEEPATTEETGSGDNQQ